MPFRFRFGPPVAPIDGDTVTAGEHTAETYDDTIRGLYEHARSLYDEVAAERTRVTSALGRIDALEAGEPPPNEAPVPAFSVGSTNGRTVTLADASTDPDGDPLTRSVVWGDGTTDASLSHTYAADGTYSITPSVSDGTTTVAGGALSVTVAAAPAGFASVMEGLGPTHWWRANETSGSVLADSAGGLPATISGTPDLAATFGLPDLGTAIGAGGRAATAADSALANPAALTLMAMVQRPSWVSLQGIFFCGSAAGTYSTSAWGLINDNNDVAGRFRFFVKDDSVEDTAAYARWLPPTENTPILMFGTWTQGGLCRLYASINGADVAQVAVGTVASTITSNAAYPVSLMGATNAGRDFNGKADEFATFDKVLTLPEMQSVVDIIWP